ncbi:hypothetical protein ACLOJK_025851 [Asimina triloba]
MIDEFRNLRQILMKTPGRTPKTPSFFSDIDEDTSRKEQERKDKAAWECSDNSTILFKGSADERSTMTTSYTFDKVFGPTCRTEKVYEEGAKDVALSALSGINGNYVTSERDFVIKISALEIYNENVVDLLNPNNFSLRLLDDPEKGTIVDKLSEEVVKDVQHLRHLINVCEEQRKIGETSLNDASSRSHQIFRLTVESSSRETSGRVESFVASLNFVDLAGSERASLTHAVGARLKEGCHINRSLLTLTTVIRKLSFFGDCSAGKRNCHIPYRESKLTRILQPSLGGNARTAIICTMSPASSHVDQSRNTLLFATQAKEVTNSAQKEVARLEAELRTPDSSSSSCSEFLLRQKIQKIGDISECLTGWAYSKSRINNWDNRMVMEMEMEEIKQQRDLAQSQLLELRKEVQQEEMESDPLESSQRVAKCLSFSGKNRQLVGKASTKDITRGLEGGPVPSRSGGFTLMNEIRKHEQLQKQLGEELKQALEVLRKVVACHQLGNEGAAETISQLLSEIKDVHTGNPADEVHEVDDVTSNPNLKEEITRLNSQGNVITTLEEQLENVHKYIDKLGSSLPHNDLAAPKLKPQSRTSRVKKILPLALSSSINRQHMMRSPCSPPPQMVISVAIENRVPGNDGVALRESTKVTPTETDSEGISSHQSGSVTIRKIHKMFKTATEENMRSIKAYVTDLKERVAKLHFQKQILVRKVLELEDEDDYDDELPEDSVASWPSEFEDLRKKIVMLWHLCHVSIIRRTQFYLLIRGDPADKIYMDVELRRLTWLEQHLFELGNASPALLGDEPAVSVAMSIRALKQERESLAKRVNSQLKTEERESLYRKLEIPPSGKQRRLMLVNKLWTDPYNMHHVQESAEVVAKLIGFYISDGQISKEMFELHFNPPMDKRSWFFGWNAITDFLHL